MKGPLSDLRVLDLSQNLAGPFCTMFLADLGAEVIKIEPLPKGDNARSFGPPFLKGESAGFLSLNRNKKSLALDIKQPQGREILLQLAKSSDVFLETFRPGVTTRLGLDYPNIKKTNPSIIYCSISGFGQSGPWAHLGGLDLIAQGMSGIMSVTGEPGRSPVKAGVPITDLGAGLIACIGILAAIQHRNRSGQGQWVETSLLEAGLAFSVWEANSYLSSGRRPDPLGSAHRLAAPYQAFPTRDGYVNIGAANQSLWEKLCKALNLEHLLDDPRFADNKHRVENKEMLAAIIGEKTSTLDTQELLNMLWETGIPSGPILHYDEVLNSPHIFHREMVISQNHTTAGPVRILGIPLKLSETAGSVRQPAPVLGQHSREILRELGYTDDRISALESRGICKIADLPPDKPNDG